MPISHQTLQKTKAIRKKLSVLSIFGLGAIITFGSLACNEVKLSPLDKVDIPSTVTINSRHSLPTPEPEQSNARVVIILDQSFSMVWGKCPTDLDGSAPLPSDSAFSSCSRKPGVDVEGHRFMVVREWIQELKRYRRENSDVKLAIIPFSGGKAERPSNNPLLVDLHEFRDISRMKFLDLEESEIWLNALQKEQDEMLKDGSSEIMGTTAFLYPLQFAYAKIKEEADLLVAEKKLSKTPFRVIFATDGVYKPIQPLFSIVKKVAGCPDCTLDPTHIACTCQTAGCWSGPLPPKTYCDMLNNNFKEYLGDPDENTLKNIQDQLNSLLSLKDEPEYSGLRLSMDFAKIHWNAVPTEDKNPLDDFTHNLFEEIKEVLTKQVRVGNITGPTPPFPVITGGQDALTFQIKNLYALNLNAFVDQFGNLVADSDGDGLSDNFELANKLSPDNPRTNGFCLDKITHQFGCQTINCLAEVDRDRDGLNECEELTLGTDDLFDTDQDHIPDLLEVLRGLNPKFNDSKLKTSGDKFTDHLHFRKGVDINLQLASVLDIYKVDLKTEFVSYEIKDNGEGKKQAFSKYQIALVNMPVLPILATSFNTEMKDDLGEKGSIITSEQRLDPTPHLKNMNQLIFLLQITTKENPYSIFWFLLKLEADGSSPHGTFTLDIDLEFEKFIQISGGFHENN